MHRSTFSHSSSFAPRGRRNDRSMTQPDIIDVDDVISIDDPSDRHHRHRDDRPVSAPRDRTPERSRRLRTPAYTADDCPQRDCHDASWSSVPPPRRPMTDRAVRSCTRPPHVDSRRSATRYDRPLLITDGIDPDHDDLRPLDAHPFARYENDDMLDDPFDYSGPPPQSSASQTSTTYTYDARSVQADRDAHADRDGDRSSVRSHERQPGLIVCPDSPKRPQSPVMPSGAAALRSSQLDPYNVFRPIYRQDARGRTLIQGGRTQRLLLHLVTDWPVGVDALEVNIPQRSRNYDIDWQFPPIELWFPKVIHH